MLYIVRGLPGSGKTTWSRANAPGMVHLEADMFFVDEDGHYNFNGEMIAVAHRWCIDTARIMMNNGRHVVVSNTFTTLKEMKPYIEHAEKIGVDIRVYRMLSQYGTIHNVPGDVIEKMKARFQDYPGEVLIGDNNGLQVPTYPKVG